MAAKNMPAAEIDVTEDLVRRLLQHQHPDLAALELTLFANGWDNAMFRLGEHLTVRVPRRQMAAVLVENEQRWLGVLAPRLPIAIPVPLRVGVPEGNYPWHWSVCPWFEGQVAADSALTDPVLEARLLGSFLGALHQPAPRDAPDNPYRGGPIVELNGRIEKNLERLTGTVDADRVMARWRELAQADEWRGEPTWLHGDIHTANVLVADGKLSAVIDFGDISAGDPAVDLAIAWMMFDESEREILRSAAGDVDVATWRRGEAWALHFAIVYLAHSADNALLRRIGVALLETLLPGAAEQTS